MVLMKAAERAVHLVGYLAVLTVMKTAAERAVQMAVMRVAQKAVMRVDPRAVHLAEH